MAGGCLGEPRSPGGNLDAACTDENESRAAMAPVLNLAQLTRESFDVKFDRFVQERRKAEARARREAEEDESSTPS